MVRSVLRARAFPVLLLSLLLTTSALTASPAAAVDTARISGQVTRAGAIGVAGVSVSVYRDAGAGQFEVVAWADTDAAGGYLVEDLPAGTYRLGFDANADDLAPEYFNNATTLATASNVLVSEGAWVQNMDVLLGPASHLTGHVSGGGLPLRFVEVDVYTDGDGDGTWEWTGWDETDVAGAYDVGGLSAGSYRLQFYSYDDDWVAEWYDDASSLDTADNVPVLAGQTVGGIDATLAASSHITGTVTGSGGTPLADVEVVVYTSEGGGWSWSGEDYTDALGGYDVGGLDAGSYRVGFRDYQGNYAPEYYDDDATLATSNAVTVGASATMAGINASLAPSAVLSGRVTRTNGAAVEYADVSVYRLVGGSYEWYAYSESDEAGNYQVRGLGAGTYRLEFYDWWWEVGEYWNNKGSLEAADSISVTTGQHVGALDAVLDPSQGPWAVKNLAPPVITGTPRVGQTLTASPGVWSPSGVTVTYQWRAGGVSIPGATGQAYNPTAADVGKTLQVRVAASRPDYWTGFAESSQTVVVAPMEPATPVAKVVANTKLPKIKGVLRVGQTVKVTAGTWKPASVTLKYQWFAGKAKIRKATKRKLVIDSKLVGKKLSVRVKASAPGYESLKVRTKRSAEVKR